MRSHIPPNAPYVKNFGEKFDKGSEDPKWIRALEAFKRASAVEGSVPRRMDSRSAWSHAKAVIDLSGEESMKYLTEKRKINKFERTTRSAAPQRKHIKHGRIIDLGDVADDFLAKKPFEDIKGQILAKVQKKFESSAELLQDQTHHEAGKSVIDALLKSKEINTDVFRKFSRMLRNIVKF
ncbi:P-loop containing nucleoside triphosphate hydrolase protein [Rhizophagus irregularis DAOM 181602=DAOM 197198]|nr:P-loop containing nucleoside triphosphate hydrolase protein [Rhizophagus irregularis DAOM 181602=DAOM 197198]